MSFFKKNIVWLIVFLALAINAVHYLNVYIPMELGRFLRIFDNGVFGKDLVDKLFLPTIAWTIFGFWFASRKGVIKYLKNNYKAIILILLVLLLGRFLSFSRWFWQEDFQFFDAFFSNLRGLPFGRYSVGLFAVSIKLFGVHFWLYNVLGLAIFWFLGIAIYAFLCKLKIDKKVSLLAVLFFMTSPTYFYQTVRYLAFIGQPFTLLMFVVACYFLIIRFYPGSLIFMAGALQHGLDVSGLAPVSLLLIALIFIDRRYKRKFDYILFLVSLFLIPLIYTGFLSFALPGKTDPLGLNNLYAYTNLIFGVTFPHAFAFSLIFFLRWALYDFGHLYLYLPVIFGGLIILTLSFLVVKFYLSKKQEVAKILLLGLTVLAVTNVVISRVSYHSPQNLSSMAPNYLDVLPAGVTTYGIFPAFGLCLIVAALGQTLKGKLFKKIILGIIIIDIISFIHADWEFIKFDSGVQRKIDSQLQTLIPNNSLTKIVYIPDISPQTVLRRKLLNFISVFRGFPKQTILLVDDGKSVVELKAKYQVTSDNIYLFLIDPSNNHVYNFSWMLNKYPFQEALLKFSSICQNKSFEGINLKYICP